MPSKINPDYQPRGNDYKVLQSEGIPRAFIDWELKNFVEYFVERGENGDKIAIKSAWNTALRKWMRRAFHGKQGAEYERNKDRIASHRQHKRKLQGNLFEEVLAGKIAEGMDKPNQIRRVYREHKTVIPDMGRMSSEDALKELRKIAKRA